MNIQVTISLGKDDDVSVLPSNAAGIAEQVLTAAGGDPEKDTCTVSIQDYGSAGTASLPSSFPPSRVPPPS
jgi:hypothetical protein